MNLSKRAFSLATALVVGATIICMSAEPAAAEKKAGSKDDGNRCVIEGRNMVPPQDEDYVFEITGAWIEAKAGPNRTAVYECQADGTWKQVMTKPRVPGRVPTGTFQQAP